MIFSSAAREIYLVESLARPTPDMKFVELMPRHASRADPAVLIVPWPGARSRWLF